MRNGIFFVDDYSGSDHVKITAAIEAAHVANGGKVILSNRKYSISQSIVLHSNINFCGEGDNSIVECSVDVPIIRIDRNYEDSLNIEISDMVLNYSEMTTTTSFHIEADRPYRLRLYRVTFGTPPVGRECAGLLTWNALSGNRTLPINSVVEGGSPSFMTHVENCIFNGSSIWLNDANSKIVNNYIWANSSSFAFDYAIRLSNVAVDISGNDIVSGAEAGIFLASTCRYIQIENNYFDGSWTDVFTGWGVCADGSTLCLILGNVFSNQYKGGVYCSSASQLNISKNIFCELNRSELLCTNCDVKFIGGGGDQSLGNLFEGNIHFREAWGGKNYALNVGDDAHAIVVDNSIMDKNKGNGYRIPPIEAPSDIYTLVKNNRSTVCEIDS